MINLNLGRLEDLEGDFSTLALKFVFFVATLNVVAEKVPKVDKPRSRFRVHGFQL